MAYLNNKQFKEICKAKQDGNPKACAIIEKYLQNGTQEELNRLVDDFYNPAIANEDVDGTLIDPAGEEAMEQSAIVEQQQEPNPTVDISSELDKELDGLIDINELADDNFEKYLENKHRDSLRSKKNNEYFKAFDEQGRLNYLDKKKDEYGHSFDTKRKDIDRDYRDRDYAISLYAQSLSDQPDDNVEVDMGKADTAYDDIVDISKKSHSFGRSWDKEDTAEVVNALLELAKQYGKKNVIAALNIIKGDNFAYRDHRINTIDKAVKDYDSKLEELLK